MKPSSPCGLPAGKPTILLVLLLLLVTTSLSGTAAYSASDDRHPGNKSFMISFDDGPGPVSTPYILEQLKGITSSEGHPVKAAFFLLGEDKSGARMFDVWRCEKKMRLPFTSSSRADLCPDPSVRSNPEVVRALERQGHFVLVHGQHHADLRRLSLEEVESEVIGCYEHLVEAGARPLRFFRSPYLSDPTIPPGSLLARGGWKTIAGISSGDGSPFADEQSVIESCRKSIERSRTYPVLLIFHDFRGLPEHRFDFGKIIGALLDCSYELRDFDPDVAVENWGKMR